MNKDLHDRHQRINKKSYLLEYHSKIKAGEIVAGRELIQQLENLIADLDSPEFIYDTRDAEFRITFIEHFCKHTKSPFYGKPFKLELWEKALIEAFYSFKWKDTGLRRFKKLILLIARKNGKSTICAALALTEFMCGGGGIGRVWTRAVVSFMIKLFILHLSYKERVCPLFYNSVESPNVFRVCWPMITLI